MSREDENQAGGLQAGCRLQGARTSSAREAGESRCRLDVSSPNYPREPSDKSRRWEMCPLAERILLISIGG